MKTLIIKDEIVQALNSNEYVISTQIGEVEFTNTSPTLRNNRASEASRSDQESKPTFVKFTAQCALSPNSSTVDVKSLITESFARFLNTTVHLKMEGIIYISEGYIKEKKEKIEEHLKIVDYEHFMAPPNATEFQWIMTDENKSYCRNENQWTPWYSTDNATSGSDFEILANHIIVYRFLYS